MSVLSVSSYGNVEKATAVTSKSLTRANISESLAVKRDISDTVNISRTTKIFLDNLNEAEKRRLEQDRRNENPRYIQALGLSLKD